MNMHDWKERIEGLPKNLTLRQVCARFPRFSRNLIYRRLKQNGYKYRSTLSYKIPTWAAKADWAQDNATIAHRFDVSRERVRQYRKRLKMPKVAPATGRKPTLELASAQVPY